MKREIKFRAWDKQVGAMGKPMTLHEIGRYAIRQRGSVNTHSPRVRIPSGTPVKDLLWMQYTGKKDKNEVEFYSGDIFKDNVGRWWVVDYRDDLASFICKWKNKKDSWQFFHQFNKLQKPLEIIGNIYENPELTKR